VADPFRGGGYPALHDSTSIASRRAQAEHFWLLRIRIGGLLAGAVGGALLISLTWITAGAWVAIIGFSAALFSEFWALRQAPDRVWYEGRAAAESTKTLTWRYAVGGDPFDVGQRPAEVDAEFLTRTRDVMSDLESLRAPDHAESNEAITSEMRRVRSLAFAERKAVYRDGRILDQQAWYRKKAAENGKSGARWSVVLIAAELFGLIGGIVVLTTAFPLDVLGVFAAAATGVTSWIQARQHRNLETAYTVTALELAAVASELESLTDENAWPGFVGAAEEAISREHTLWRASRSSRFRARRS
jgi:hypothetical protein